MKNQEKRRPGRPPDPNTPKRKQVHLFLPEEDYNAIKAIIGTSATMNTWIVKTIHKELQREQNR